jgi:hypothetical protein
MLSPVGGLIVINQGPQGVSHPKNDHYDSHERTVLSMYSRTTLDSIDQPPRYLIFCSVTPTMYAAVVYVLRKKCEVQLKHFTKGRSRSADVTSWNHPVSVLAAHLSCFSDPSIAQRAVGYFSAREIASNNIEEE